MTFYNFSVFLIGFIKWAFIGTLIFLFFYWFYLVFWDWLAKKIKITFKKLKGGVKEWLI
jgi:predicted ferric reductase